MKPRWPECRKECSWCGLNLPQSEFNAKHSKWCSISGWIVVMMFPITFLWLIFGRFVINWLSK